MVDLCHSGAFGLLFDLPFLFQAAGIKLRSSIVSSSAQLFKDVILAATDMNKLARLFHS